MQTHLDYIQQTLRQILTPTTLEVIDESHQHQGHGGYNSAGSHFAITIASPAFTEKSLLECHQLVYQALGAKVGKEIHALRINIKR